MKSIGKIPSFMVTFVGFRFFAKKNKKEEEKGKKLHSSANLPEAKKEENFIKKEEKIRKDVRNDLNMTEILNKVRNTLDYHLRKEKIYQKKIGLLEQKVRDLQGQLSKKV